MEQMLLQKFRAHMKERIALWYLELFLCTAFLTVAVLSYCGCFIPIRLSQPIDLVLLVFASVCEGCVLIGGLVFLWQYRTDRRVIKDKTYREIDGTVLRFAFGREGSEPSVEYCVPVIKDRNTGEILTLALDRQVEEEGRYLICLLPKSKLAFVVKKISNE